VITPTVTLPALIDVNSEGITLTFEGVDADIAELIFQALDFRSIPPTYFSAGTSSVSIKTSKKITFTDKPVPAAPNVTTSVNVDGESILTGADNTMEYSLDGGVSYLKYIDGTVFSIGDIVWIRVAADPTTLYPAGAVTIVEIVA